MRNLKYAFALVVFLAAFGAATAQSKIALDSAKHADVIRLLRATGSAEIGVQVMDNMLISFADAFPQVPEELWEEVRKEFTADALLDLVIPAYEKYFSHEEIKELLAFYESPIGKKLVDRMPLLTQETMTAGQKWGEEVAEKIMNKLAAKGYKKM